MVRMPTTHSLSLEPELVAVEIAMIEHPVLLAPISTQSPDIGSTSTRSQTSAPKKSKSTIAAAVSTVMASKSSFGATLQVGRIVGRSSFLCTFELSLFDELTASVRAPLTKVAKAPPRSLRSRLARRQREECRAALHRRGPGNSAWTSNAYGWVILRLGLGIGLGLWLGLGIGI